MKKGSLRWFLPGLVAVLVCAQEPPKTIIERTPAPSREGVGVVQRPAPGMPGVSFGSKASQVSDSPTPTTEKKGGSYAIEIDPDSEEDPASIAAEAELDTSGASATDPGAQLARDPLVQRKNKVDAARRARVTAAESQTLQDIKSELRAQSESQQRFQDRVLTQNEKREDALFGKRDATKTDAVADAEFAEASASRRASSIARQKGYSLVPALRTIRLRMRTASDTEQAGGKATAVVLDNVWDATHSSIAIPAGTLARLFIEGASGDTDTRIRLTITEFQLPGGDAIQLRVPDAATDEIGATGPKASVDHRYGTRFFGAVGYAFMAAISASGARSAYSTNASFDDVLRSNLAGQFGQAGSSQFQTGMSAKPVMKLPEGRVVHMILGTNLYLVPWQRVRPIMPVPNMLLQAPTLHQPRQLVPAE